MKHGFQGNDTEGSVGWEYIEGEDEDNDEYTDVISGNEDDELLEELSTAGYSDPEIVGASSKRKRKKLGPLGRTIVSRNAAMIINREANRRRRYPSGFEIVPVAVGASAQVPSAPQNLFRIERLIVPSDIGFDFGITDIKVGNTSQLVQSLELPAAMFSEVAIDTNVWFDTARVGNQVSLAVRNKGPDPLDFTAGMIGSVAKA